MIMKKSRFMLIVMIGLWIGTVVQPMRIHAAGLSDDLTYVNFVVQIAPEYTEPEGYPEDTPNVLVAYLGYLKNTGNEELLNEEITISLPDNITNFMLTTLGDFQGDSTQVKAIQDYTIDEEARTLTWRPNYSIKTDEVYSYVLEFFYNPIETSKEGNKSFTFSLTSPVAAEQLGVLIDQPAGSDAFLIDMEGAQTSLTPYGTLRYGYTFEEVKAGEKKNFPISYTKADNKSTQEMINDGEWNIPTDETHSMLNNGSGESGDATSNTAVTKPLIGTIGALLISASVILAAVLIIVAILYKKKTSEVLSQQQKNIEAEPQKVKKGIKSTTEEEKKKLRSQLLAGEIDQKTYDSKMSKLL